MHQGDTLAAVSATAFAEFDRWREDFLGALEAQAWPGDREALWSAARERFGALLSQCPDPGWRAPTLRMFSVSGAVYIAVFLATRPHATEPAAVWSLCEDATRRHFARMRGLERRAASAGMFSLPMRWLTRSMDARSREAPVADWSVRYVQGDGESFDFGVDYERCAIRELALRVGAEAFAPYICLADRVGSEAFGWGLRRTETLAQGGTRCDFRFRRGGPTDVRVRLPVVRA